ncbi:MAG: ABC transporter ATP-binding protein [Pseudomonas sp.]
MFLGQTRKQMLAKVDEIAEFTELGEYLSMPLRTYSTGMRVRLAMGVVTSIDPEILLLDEGIGAVDAEFLKKARGRLQALVERSGILVFASHSNEFLARLCKTAMWIDHGTVRMTGRDRGRGQRLRGRGRRPARPRGARRDGRES